MEIDSLMDLLVGEIKDARRYAMLALEYKDKDKELADLYCKLASEELDHMSRLHAQVLRLIDNQRRVDPESLPRTMAVYDHLHKRDIDQVAEIGVLQMQYKSK